MDKQRALELIDALDAIVPPLPGPAPDLLTRIGAVARDLRVVLQDDSYACEKLQQVEESVSIYLSPRRWVQYGSDGVRARQNVRTDLAKLRKAVTTPIRPHSSD